MDGGERRFVFRTEGVCPSEITFVVRDGRLHSVRFEGGGCKGNALFIGRLVEGRRLAEVAEMARGIPCRGETSCPDQLARAVDGVLVGSLRPAVPYRVFEPSERVGRLGVVGEVAGDAEALRAALAGMRAQGMDRILVLGNLVGPRGDVEEVLDLVSAPDVWALAGDADWARVASGSGGGLDTLPHVIAVDLEGKRLVAFQGDYITRLDGFSDYGPYALEMNMVCGLAGFLSREEVLPALAAMTEQFAADAVAFSQPGRWSLRRVGRVDFVSVGPVCGEGSPRWGVLEVVDGTVRMDVRTAGGSGCTRPERVGRIP